MQGLFRRRAVDVELRGVHDPGRRVVNVRFASANRDERAVRATPETLDLEREQAPAPRLRLRHAPLPRRAARPARAGIGFRALVERVDELWFIDGANDFGYHQNYFLRALQKLHIGFRPAGA